MPITRDDWLAAINAAECIEAPDADAVTAEEFAIVIGMARQSATKRLRRLVAMGTAVKTKKRIQRGDGTWIAVTAYRLVTAEPDDETRTR